MSDVKTRSGCGAGRYHCPLMSGFKRKEPVTVGARRIVCAELETAIQALSRPGKRDASAIAGNALARASACLEQVAPMLTRETARQDRKRLARVRQTLDGARLGRQLAQRLDKLLKQGGLDAAEPSAKALRKSLTRGVRGSVALQARGRSFDPMVYRLVAELAELRGRVGHWPEPREQAAKDPPPPGLIVCYRKARTLAGRSKAQPETLDAAGASLSQMVLALTLVAKACPALIKPQRALIAEAADATRRQALDAALAGAATELEAKGPLSKALRDAQQSSRADALRLVADAHAYALAETPQAFAKRLGAYWSAWRATDPGA